MFLKVFSNVERISWFGKCVNYNILSRNICLTNSLQLGKYCNLKNSSVLQHKLLKEYKYIQPYDYFIQIPGKLINAKLAEACNIWLQIPNEELNNVMDISQALHNTTLIVDDILDNALTRRDKPSVHAIFGSKKTINVTNLMYLFIVQHVSNLGHPDAPKVVLEALADVYKGQGMEINFTDTKYCPTEKEYYDMVMFKSGAFFETPIKLIQLISKHKYDLNPLLTAFVKYFQIRDDYMDLIEENYMKDLYNTDDITACRYTFPIIHAIKNNPNDNEVEDILHLKKKDNIIKRHLISLLKKYGSLEYTCKEIIILEDNLRNEINKIGKNEVFMKTIDYLRATGKYADK